MTDEELHRVLADRVASVRTRIAKACARAGRDAAEVTLIAVSKTTTPQVAAMLPALGVSDLGESRPQELWKKAAEIPGVRWHFVGHLQRNKLERTMALVSLFHSVDSERLLRALDEFGRKSGSPIAVLLEVNCSREEAKGGLAVENLPEVSDIALSLTGVRFEGLMTMAAYEDNPEASRPTFAELRELSETLRSRTGLPLPHLSMGMSNDFEIAIEEGATHIRIGTMLFEGMPGRGD